jgi:CelD/BcsL family acetyltransferase involved in cellulose biosynthesis
MKPTMPTASLETSLRQQPESEIADQESRPQANSLLQAGPLCVEWIESGDCLSKLQPGWQDLFVQTGSRNAFLTFGWMSTWWKHWGGGSSLAVIAVRNSAGQLVGLAPFYISRVRGLRRLGFLADERVGSDYLSVLLHPDYEDAALEEVASALLARRSRWDFIELQDAEDSPLLRRLQGRLQAKGMHGKAVVACLCPFAQLPPSVEAYLASLSGGWRRDFNRRCRVLERESGVEFVALRSTTDMQRAFPDLIRLHGMRFETQDLESAFLKPGVPEFHSAALPAMAAEGWARMYLLRTKTEIIAALYGFAVRDGFQYYQLGIDPAWQKSGLGKVIMGRVIGHSIENGCVEFDMLRGGESYKSNWVNQTRQTVTVRLFDRRLRSLVAERGFQARAMAAAYKAQWNQWLESRRERSRVRPAEVRSETTEESAAAARESKSEPS